MLILSPTVIPTKHAGSDPIALLEGLPDHEIAQMLPNIAPFPRLPPGTGIDNLMRKEPRIGQDLVRRTKIQIRIPSEQVGARSWIRDPRIHIRTIAPAP